MRSGRNPPQLVDILFGAYRRQILALLLLRPDESFYVREIARLTGVPAGSLHRELKLLTDAGLLQRAVAGNQVRYQVDRTCPIHDPAIAGGEFGAERRYPSYRDCRSTVRWCARPMNSVRTGVQLDANMAELRFPPELR